jgi:hypothetical protein
MSCRGYSNSREVYRCIGRNSEETNESYTDNGTYSTCRRQKVMKVAKKTTSITKLKIDEKECERVGKFK